MAKRKRLNEKATFETAWLAKKLTVAWRKSGKSRRQWLKDSGLDEGENAQTHISYLLSGKRGLSFTKAVRLATYAGVDLSDLQRELGGWR